MGEAMTYRDDTATLVLNTLRNCPVTAEDRREAGRMFAES
jgi:hypothetical protein